EAPTLVFDEEDVTEESQVVAPSEIPLSKDELCAIYDKALQRHQKIVLKRQQTVDQERLGDPETKTSEASVSEESGTVSGVEVPPKSTPRQRLLSCGQPALIATEAELESVIKSLNTVLASCDQPSETPIKEGENSSTGEKSDNVDVATRPVRSASYPEARDDTKEHFKTLDDFDFREEFDRRFRQRKTQPTARVDLPVIGRPNKEDVVQSYRRRGLFDNVDYRQPPSVHHIASLDVPDNAAKTHTAFSFDEMDLVAEPDGNTETNNNVLTPNTYLTNKIIRAVLAEKPGNTEERFVGDLRNSCATTRNAFLINRQRKCGIPAAQTIEQTILSRGMSEKEERPSLRPVAFAAVVFSTVALTSCLLTFPMILHYVQTLESQVQLDLEYCQARARDMWKEMLNIETGGKRDVAKLADIVMTHRRLEKR
ncbi:nematode cuticle collagen domain protein, partial [Teladorsagia circumcincta]